MFETPFIYFCHVISPLPRIVFYLESRKSDPREEIYGKTEDRLHNSFNVFIARLLIGGLEEKGTSMRIDG